MIDDSNKKTQIVGPVYCVTIQGISKLIQMVCSSVALILLYVAPEMEYKKLDKLYLYLFRISAGGSILITLAYFILYMVGVVQHLMVSVNRLQAIFHIPWSIFYGATSILLIYYGVRIKIVISICSFGFFASVAHFVDGVDNCFKDPLEKCKCGRCRRKNNDDE